MGAGVGPVSLAWLGKIIMTFVQYCPCGHTGTMDEDIPRKLNQLDAPILPSKDCPECQEFRDRQDALNAMWCSDPDENWNP